MISRPRRAGAGASLLLLLLAVMVPMAAPGAAQQAPAPSLEGLCWMGTNRPIFRVRNAGTGPLEFTVRSGSAVRTGTVVAAQPAAIATDTAYVVGTGRFPNAVPALLRWSSGGASAERELAATEGLECTYNLTPVVRFVDARGQPKAPPAGASSLTVTLTSSVERLDCRWGTAGLACTQKARPGAPLPAGSYRTLRTELQVPAFTTAGRAPQYSVVATAPPGHRVAAGSGTFALDDLGAGLGQANADARLRPFFPLKGARGSQDRELVITFVDASARPGVGGPATRPASPPKVAGPTTTAPATTVVRALPRSAPPPAARSTEPDLGGAIPGAGAMTIGVLAAGSLLAALLVARLARTRRPPRAPKQGIPMVRRRRLRRSV